MNCCYIVRRNVITNSDVTRYREELQRFHELRKVFIETGVRTSVELPRQHAMMHYADAIELFGSPNGICSSITESKHIKAIKEPWRRSSRNQALNQMLRTITRLEQLAALRTIFTNRGMLAGSVTWYTAQTIGAEPPPINDFGQGQSIDDEDEVDNGDKDDGEPVEGAKQATEVQLAVREGKIFDSFFFILI
jgi:hypothetical protein